MHFCHSMVQAEEKDNLGYIFTSPCQLDFLKEKADVTTSMCGFVLLFIPKDKFESVGHFCQISWGVRPPKEAILSPGQRDMMRKRSPKGGDTAVWAGSLRHWRRSIPGWHHWGRSFSEILKSAVDTSVSRISFLLAQGVWGVQAIKSQSHRSCIGWI